MDRETTNPLPEQILSLLAQRGALKATQIGQALQADRTAVNQALYGALAGRVVQDKSYRWSAASGLRQAVPTEVAATPSGPLARLCRYFIDCLAHDAEQGCSVFAASNREDLKYAPLVELPHLRASGTWSAPMDNEAQRLVQRSRLDRSAVLYIGYPVLLRYHRTAKWEGYFVEPILLCPLEAGEGGALQVADEVPSLNFKALRSLGDGGNVLDDVVALSEELGLVNDEEPPTLDEIALRLQAVRPDWPWIDSPVLGDRKLKPDISSINAAGIYNYAVVVLGERPNFTKGLEAELKALSVVSEQKIQGTALGQWVGASASSTPIHEDEALIEVVALNSEQRAAVRSALTAHLTVITGPPGTGKSQVVTALLANCAWRGQKVLFASKNNKAVDVVEQRINGLSARPTLIRLGSRQYEARLAEFLMGLLNATAGPEDQSEYDSALESQKRLSVDVTKLELAAQKLVDTRNLVDGLESKVESWRAIFGEALGQLQTVDPAALRATLLPLEQAAAAADVGNAGFFEGLIWFALRSKRFERLHATTDATEVIRALRILKLRAPERAVDDAGVKPFLGLVNASRERLLGIEAIQEYWQALQILSGQRSLEELARQRSVVENRLAENALGLWQAWTRLQPVRLEKADRQALGRYHALLQVILDSSRAREQIPTQSWRQYRDIVPKISHLIPCWAVTSLSAHGKVPFEPSAFDLLVIDEASQCDIASALPLLYRAKRVAVIGDPKQLTHISKLSPRQDAHLQQKHGLPLDLTEWSYSVNSLYALASTQAEGNGFVSLRDHHRSHSDIIGFSNRQFYDGRLRVATPYDRLKRVDPDGPAVRWFHVEGHVRRPPSGSVVNDAEAQAVVKFLRTLVLDRKYEGTIGVVSPYRAHSNRIRDLVNADGTLADRLARLEFIAETAHQFQGDERDVIVFSPVVSRGIAEGSLGFLRKNGNLFNVAITRARAALYVVGDKLAARESRVDYLAGFSKYADEIQDQVRRQEEIQQETVLGPRYPAVARPDLVSDWEKVLYRALFAAGIRSIPQYSVEKYLLDLAVVHEERRLNIEVDGERYHRAWDGELMRRDRLRNQRMIELGWDVKRFWVYQVRDQLDQCVAEIKKWVDSRS